MYSLDLLLSHFSISTPGPELYGSQFEAYSRQVPLLYLILLITSLAIAVAQIHVSPAGFPLYIPPALGLMCVAGRLRWRRPDQIMLEDLEVARRLRLTTWTSMGLSIVAFTSSELALYPFGGACERVHVALFMSVTVLGCVSCLTRGRTAALLLTATVIVSCTVLFSLTWKMDLIAISFSALVMSVAMALIPLTYHRDFAKLVDSKRIVQTIQLETEKLNDENLRLANTDSLTLLPNRRRFFADLEALITRASSSGHSIAVGVIGLDGFKQVNDLYGHSAGDSLLAEVGLRLEALSRPHIAMARLGGDEFGLLIEDVTNSQALLAFGTEVCAALRMPYVLSDATAVVSCSLGIAAFPEAGKTGAHLFERADYALSFAKAYRRGETVIFSPEQEHRIRYRSQLEQSMRSADFESEMRVEFQPIFDMTSNRVIAFEALARWTSPSLGPVAPSEFIPIAESSDLIHSVTHVLLSKALDAAANWPSDIRLSFNLSARDIASANSIQRIIDTIILSGVSPNRIDIEVTESALIRDFEQARAALDALKRFGVQISLDDFGTGYSSLSSVHRLPLDKIKVDRSFVKNVVSDSICRDIVESIVSLCRKLRLSCVVEGVESTQQAMVLHKLGCTTMQGYIFGKPIPAEDVLKMQLS